MEGGVYCIYSVGLIYILKSKHGGVGSSLSSVKEIKTNTWKLHFFVLLMQFALFLIALFN